MAYAYVKTTTGTANGNTVAFTYTPGNLLILQVGSSTGGGTPTFTAADTDSNTYQQGSASANAGNNYWHGWRYVENAGGDGSTTVTVTFNGGTPGETAIKVHEYSGLATSGALIGTPIAANQANPGTGTDAITAGPLNVTSQPALVIGLSGSIGGDPAFTAGTGYTARSTTVGLAIEDKRVTSTGNQSATFTSSGGGSNIYRTIVAAFAEPANATATATPAQATETVAGQTPSLLTERVIAPTVGLVTVGSVAPSALGEDQIGPTTGAVQTLGRVPSLLAERAITPSTGVVTLGSLAPTLTGDGLAIGEPAVAALTLSGLSPTLLTELITQPNTSQIIIGGQIPTADTGDASAHRGHVGTGRRWHGKAGKYEGPLFESAGASEVFPTEALSFLQPAHPLGGVPQFKPLESFPVGVDPSYTVPPELLAESRARIAARKKRRRAEEDLILKLLS